MNSFDTILNNIAKHISLDEKEIGHFTELLKAKKVARKTLLLTENQKCNYIYFVNNGILRAYFLDKSGKESTIMFAIKDWWITDMNCFVNEKPAILNIEAIEDSIVWQLSKENLDALYSNIPKFERFFRIIMQNAYIREQTRMIENLSLTAEERYEIFIHKYPKFVDRITQKQIASYLGITPEFLSIMKTNRLKKINS